MMPLLHFHIHKIRRAVISLAAENSAMAVCGVATAWLILRQCSLREKVIIALLGDLAVIRVAAMVAMGRAQEATAITIVTSCENDDEVGPTCEFFRRESKVNANYIHLNWCKWFEC
jgi:hypothetical protein